MGKLLLDLSEDQQSLLPSVARISESLRSLFDEWSGSPDKQQGLLDGAAQAVAASLERWRSTGGVMRFTQTSSLDRLAGCGAEVEVTLPVGRFTRLIATTARIRLGDTVLAQKPFNGGKLLVRANLETPGNFPLVVDALDGQGRVLVSGNARTAPLVQIVGDTPTVAVDAELLLPTQPPPRSGALSLFSEPAKALELPPEKRELFADLRRLHDRGFALTYFDFHPEDRQQDLRTVLAEHGLPAGAILVHPSADVEFQTMGIDFRKLFVATRIRRLRADGVPLMLLLSDAPEHWNDACTTVGVSVFDRPQLHAFLQPEGEPKLLAMRKRAVEFQRSFRSTPRMRWRLDHLGGGRPIAHNRCAVEFDNRLARERLFATIDGATKSVCLQFYILAQGAFSDRLAVHLVRRAREGVAIRIIVDALYSTQEVLGLRNPVVEGLAREPGIQIVAVSPISAGEKVQLGQFKRRNHRKIIIVDDRIAFVGGRNCSDEYYTGFDEVAVADWTPHERIPWLDAHVEVEGPLVKDVVEAFETTWHDCNPDDQATTNPVVCSPSPAADQPDPPAADTPELQKHVGTTTARLVLHRGLHDTNTMGAYEALIDGAESHLYILNDFPILASLRDALLRALDRDIRVELLTGCALARRGDGTLMRGPAHREMFEYMTKHSLEPLIRAGARAYEFTTPPLPDIVATGGVVRPYVHAKVMTADGQMASIGSANLDVTASYWEDEANIVLEDPKLVACVEDTIREFIARAYPIDLNSEYWLRELPKRELAGRLWPQRLYS